jgi:hypothetical protein
MPMPPKISKTAFAEQYQNQPDAEQNTGDDS